MAADPNPLPVAGHPASGLPIQAGLTLDIVSADPDILDAVPLIMAAQPLFALWRRTVILLDRRRRRRLRRQGLLWR